MQETERNPDLPGLYELITVDKTDSARAHAERLAQEGADEGTIVWAKTQNAGLGRKGNYWMSGHKNLHCALILRPEHNYPECCQLSLLATICAAMAISRQAEPMDEFHFRWPNDVLLNHGKIAGITLSGELADTSVQWLVVGLNVNVYDNPSSKGFDGSSMRSEGFATYDRVRVMEAYTREFLSWINKWAETGFESVRKSWITKGIGSNEPITIRWDKQESTGIAKDIHTDGSLILSANGAPTVVSLTEFFQADFTCGSVVG